MRASPPTYPVACPDCGSEFDAYDWRARIRLVVDTGCWEWIGGKSDTGYGSRSIAGRTVSVHRWVYERLRGPIPEGAILLHSCDNRACCNPDHLTPGTQAENMAQASLRGGLLRGEDAPWAKLTTAAVRDIRRRSEEGEPRTSIALDYGVVPSAITYVVQRKTWGHVI